MWHLVHEVKHSNSHRNIHKLCLFNIPLLFVECIVSVHVCVYVCVGGWEYGHIFLIVHKSLA